MRRFLPPQHVLGLVVAGLLLLMAAGVAMMRHFGPRGGQLVAMLYRK
jgi:hypothetical protein